MNPILNIAIRAIRKGGNIIIQNYDTRNFLNNDIDKKKYFIQNILYKTNKIIYDTIYKSYPNHIILHKNQYPNITLKEKVYWIINELDGICNFSKNFPHFCISIAVMIKGIIEISVIYDPIKNDLFTAVKGQGSQLNGYRTRCTNTNILKSTIISVNLPKNNDISISYFKIYQKLLSYSINFLCTGSSILDLAYVSCGKVDCFFDFNPNPINCLAGKLQAQEAGCLLSYFPESHQEKKKNTGILISSSKFIRLIIEKISENMNI